MPRPMSHGIGQLCPSVVSLQPFGARCRPGEHRLLASDEEGRDHVRKYDNVAQRQRRIGSGFTWRKRWAWLCRGHGPNSVLLFLSATPPLCTATAECRWPRKRIQAAAAISAAKGRYDMQYRRSRPHVPKNSVISASFGPEIKIPANSNFCKMARMP
jgi:hypothetical protein